MTDEDRYPVAIVGTRDYYPDDVIFYAGEKMRTNHPEGILIVTGDAKGVDAAAIGYAQGAHCPYISEKALWDTLGHGAGHERNARVIAKARVLLAFLHPQAFIGLIHSSPGTCDAITQAYDRGLQVYAHHQGRWLNPGQVQTIVDQVHAKRAQKPKEAPE